MPNKKELPTPFIQEKFPMPEYESLKKELWKEPDLDKYRDALNKYKEKIKDENLSSRQKKEYEKIIKFLDTSIKRKDAQSLLHNDEEYLKGKFGMKYNV